MKIIKVGKHQAIRFTCEQCGCVFEADEREYARIILPICKNERIEFIDMVNVVCPFCKKTITKRLN